MRECLGKHWCMSFVFRIVMLNYTCLFYALDSNYLSRRFECQKLIIIIGILRYKAVYFLIWISRIVIMEMSLGVLFRNFLVT